MTDTDFIEFSPFSKKSVSQPHAERSILRLFLGLFRFSVTMLHCVTILGVVRHCLSANRIHGFVDSPRIACIVAQASILWLLAVAMAEKVERMFYRGGERRLRYGQVCSHLSSIESTQINLPRFQPAGSSSTALTPSKSLMKSSITGARTRLLANRWFSKDKRSDNSARWTVFRTLFLAPTEKNIQKIKINLVLRRENPGYAPIQLPRT